MHLQQGSFFCKSIGLHMTFVEDVVPRTWLKTTSLPCKPKTMVSVVDVRAQGIEFGHLHKEIALVESPSTMILWLQFDDPFFKSSQLNLLDIAVMGRT
ncbi:hypothetical protein AMTR_s00103p00145030 [Amborella trichopoda]|uniref:Uncharacterized protein n=1 Tax=Amborella trichopoda TaxID=13333 RepID=W1P004_AMBTC|nr:hypothetical protein AMTR_s00103p00145030 [Amborella trichopoda]